MKTAAEAAKYAINNRKKIILEKNKIEQKPRLKLNKYYLFIPIIILCSLFFIEKKYEVKGYVRTKLNQISNQKIHFIDREKNLKETSFVDEKGYFQLKLKKGNYKIHFNENVPSKYLSPETSPLLIRLNRDLNNLKIYIN